jgi:hypothetical protein
MLIYGPNNITMVWFTTLNQRIPKLISQERRDRTRHITRLDKINKTYTTPSNSQAVILRKRCSKISKSDKKANDRVCLSFVTNMVLYLQTTFFSLVNVINICVSNQGTPHF